MFLICIYLTSWDWLAYWGGGGELASGEDRFFVSQPPVIAYSSSRDKA